MEYLNLRQKKKYIVHYGNLQLYFSLGMKLSKIHTVIKFKQSNWLKEYIHFNKEKRMNVKDSYERDLFKLMANSIYGKTAENIRKRINCMFLSCHVRV